MRKNRWSLNEIESALKEAHQELSDCLTLERYEQWRKRQIGKYPSEATIRRQYGNELEVKELLGLGQTRRKLKWSEDRIWACLTQAYQDLIQEGLSLTPKNYNSWRSKQSFETPAYTSINEKIGSFKLILQQYQKTHLQM